MECLRHDLVGYVCFDGAGLTHASSHDMLASPHLLEDKKEKQDKDGKKARRCHTLTRVHARFERQHGLLS